MRLNASKCQQLHLGMAVPLSLHIDGNQEIARVQTVSDLGILIASSLSPSEQIDRAVQRARSVLFMNRRRFSRITPTIFWKAYNALVKPHLEHVVHAWAPVLKRDIKRLESVQRLPTRMVAGLHDLTYEQRLTRLNLFSLERRRLRGDLIETFKIVHGFTNMPVDQLFQILPANHPTRHHSLSIVQLRALCSKTHMRGEWYGKGTVCPTTSSHPPPYPVSRVRWIGCGCRSGLTCCKEMA